MGPGGRPADTVPLGVDPSNLVVQGLTCGLGADILYLPGKRGVGENGIGDEEVDCRPIQENDVVVLV